LSSERRQHNLLAMDLRKLLGMGMVLVLATLFASCDTTTAGTQTTTAKKSSWAHTGARQTGSHLR
jgi:hypothetical protein